MLAGLRGDLALERDRRDPLQANRGTPNRRHVVSVYDIGEEGGEIFVVSQLMRGDLSDRLAEAPNRQLPTEDVLRLARGIASGREHAHRLGMIHRDLPARSQLYSPRHDPSDAR